MRRRSANCCFRPARFALLSRHGGPTTTTTTVMTGAVYRQKGSASHGFVGEGGEFSLAKIMARSEFWGEGSV